MNELFVRIRFLLPSLPRAEKAIAEALLEHPEAITDMTLAQLSEESSTSEASIVRFSKRLGFSGYTEMKNAFINAVAEGGKPEEEEIGTSDNMKTILQKVYQSNVQTLSDTLVLAENEYDDALAALLKAKSIHFFGTGDAYAVCLLACMKFKRLGIPCSAEGDVMLQLLTASNLTAGDVAVAISYEGRSKNVVEAMRIAKKVNATTISITKRSKSPLLKYTDIPLFIAVTDLSIGRDKITRRVSDQFIIDALYLGYATNTRRDYKQQLKRSQIAIDANKL